MISKVRRSVPKLQQVRPTLQLSLRDPVIAEEDKILQKLMHTVRAGAANATRRRPLTIQPGLYRKYRTKDFPLKNDRNRKYPAWRSLSPWMKLQLASMCIAEHPHVQIRLRLHEELVDALNAGGKDYRVFLRDRLTSILGNRFGPGTHYLFVLEDLDRDGLGRVRTHAHGMAMLPSVNLTNMKDGRTKAANERLIGKVGLRQAQFVRGRAALREALHMAVGNRGKPARPRVVNGMDQASNVWTKESYNALFNREAISYAFKNSDSEDSRLPPNRIARSQALVTEARMFWDLVRLGEPAIAHWSAIREVETGPA